MIYFEYIMTYFQKNSGKKSIDSGKKELDFKFKIWAQLKKKKKLFSSPLTHPLCAPANHSLTLKWSRYTRGLAERGKEEEQENERH